MQHDVVMCVCVLVYMYREEKDLFKMKLNFIVMYIWPKRNH